MAGSYEDDMKELFTVAGVQSHYFNLNNLIINQMQTSFFNEANKTIDPNTFNEDQRKQIGEILKARFGEMVKNYDGFVKTFLPYEKFVDEVYIPLYKEYYSHEEVKQLLAFYKTDVGKKSIVSAQQISQLASTRSIEKYDSRISEFVETQIKENMSEVEDEVSRILIN